MLIARRQFLSGLLAASAAAGIAQAGNPLLLGAGSSPVIGGGGGGVTSLVMQTSANVNTASVTGPAGIIAGDVLVWHDFGEASSSLPADALPTGFTQIANINDGGTKKQITAYKKADGSEASATLTGMNTLKMNKQLYVFRPNVAATTLTLGSVHQEANSAAPSNQLCAASAGTPPLVVVGCWGSNGVVTTRGMTITKDGELTNTNNNTQYTDYKLYNSAPADITFSMADYGQNFLTSFYIAVA